MASVMPGVGHVQHRRASDVDPDLAQIVGDQPAQQPGRFAPGRADRAAASRPMSRRRRQAAPMRRPQAHHPAALLVDEDRQRGGPRARRVQLVGQRPELGAVGAVALEQDDAGRRQRQQQLALGGVSVVPAMPTMAARGAAPRAHASLTVRSARR